MEPCETQILRIRLHALERRLRVMSAAWTASLVLVALVGIVVQQAASQSSVLRVRALEVVDASGRPRIYLSTLRGWPEIGILDTSTHRRFSVSMDPGESFATLSLEGRTPRTTLALTVASRPFLEIGDRAGDHVSLTLDGLKRTQFGGCGNCPDKTIWSVP